MITPLTEPVLIDETSAVAEALPKSSLMSISSVDEYKIPLLSTETSFSMFRIVNYNTHFEKPAPFYFKIKNPSLQVIKKSDFDKESVEFLSRCESLRRNLHLRDQCR